jgi:hypothetical protein
MTPEKRSDGIMTSGQVLDKEGNMHHQTDRALYESFPLEDKNGFFADYLYLRYPEHFICNANPASGLPAEETAEKAA